MDPMGKIPYTLWDYQQCGDRRIGMRYFFHPVTAKSSRKKPVARSLTHRKILATSSYRIGKFNKDQFVWNRLNRL